jgi:hypothetical protein
MATIEQRRKTDRERFKRWRKKKLAEGNRQIQLMITPEAQKALKDEKARTGEPYVQIINRAIINVGKGLSSISAKIKIRPKDHSIIADKTEPRPRSSAKSKPRFTVLDKTKKNTPEQLNLFIASES